jgi:hypothetical protein
VSRRRLGEPEHLLLVEERGGVGGGCLGEACSLEKTQVAVSGRWPGGGGDALLQPHHIPDSELHGHSTSSGSTELSAHQGEKKRLTGGSGCWRASPGTGNGDRLVGLEAGGCGLLAFLVGGRGLCGGLFGGLEGWPLNSTGPFVRSFVFGYEFSERDLFFFLTSAKEYNIFIIVIMSSSDSELTTGTTDGVAASG